MKILMINSGVYSTPTSKGGLENVVYRLSNEIAKLGHQVDLVTDISKDSHFHDNIQIYRIGLPSWSLLRTSFWGYVLRHIIGGFLAFWRTRLILKNGTNRYDVIHMHGRFAPFLLSFYYRRRKNLVYTLHDDKPDRGMNHFQIFQVSHKLCVAATKKATRTIVLHQQGYKTLLSSGTPYNKIRIIPNGVDTSVFKNKECQRGEHCLFVGSLIQRKGINYLLQALKITNNLICLIVGEGSEKNNLARQTRELGIDNRVKFLGPVYDPNKLSTIYNEARFLVLPSLSEGMPLVVLEAMACGTPIVASRLPGIIPLIHEGENGFLFEPGNIEELSKKLHQMMEYQDAHVYTEQGISEMIKHKFSLSSIAQSTIDLYKELINEKVG